jgi:hypothetical protein
VGAKVMVGEMSKVKEMSNSKPNKIAHFGDFYWKLQIGNF